MANKPGVQHEIHAAVEIDVAAVDGAFGVVDIHAAFEDVGVFLRIGPGRLGAGQVEQLAQLGEEKLVVGALLAAGVAPAVDEGFDRVVFRVVAGLGHALGPLNAVLKRIRRGESGSASGVGSQVSGVRGVGGVTPTYGGCQKGAAETDRSKRDFA